MTSLTEERKTSKLCNSTFKKKLLHIPSFFIHIPSFRLLLSIAPLLETA